MKDTTKRWLMFLGSLLLLKPMIDIRKDELKEYEAVKIDKDKFAIDLIRTKNRLLSQSEIVDQCFEMYGDWGAGDFPALRVRLTELWKMLEKYDPDRRQRILAERLGEPKKSWEEVMK